MWVDGVDSILFVTTLLECMEVCMHLSELLYIASANLHAYATYIQCLILYCLTTSFDKASLYCR